MTESTKVWLMPILLVMVVLPDIQASNCRYCNKKEIEEKRFLLEKECAKKEGNISSCMVKNEINEKEKWKKKLYILICPYHNIIIMSLS